MTTPTNHSQLNTQSPNENHAHQDSAPLLCILGPTASGKTKLGVALAKAFEGEIISVDSRQVYRGMDIGTGKDLDEYQGTAYHLIDICEANEEYSVFNFIEDFNAAHARIAQAGKLSIAVGGTGMYLDALLNRYQLTRAELDLKDQLAHLSDAGLQAKLLALNPALHNSTDLTERRRTLRAIEIETAKQQGYAILQAHYGKSLVIGIASERELTRQRITLRLKQRLEQGMIEEVEQLRQQGVSWQQLHYFGLEYRYIALYLKGELSYNDMYQKLNSAIHQFAKQQDKWFRNIAKKGVDIHWLHREEGQQGESMVENASQICQRFLTEIS